MPRLWLPKVTKYRGPHDTGGSMAGGPPRALWHSTENDPTSPGITDSVARYLIGRGFEPTIIWNPHTGELGQFLPADRSAYALEHPLGTPETNRQGDVCIQIEVVARATHPFTKDHPLRGLDEMLAWFAKWGIPEVWPGGRPLSYPKSYGEDNGDRSLDAWLHHAGHFAHSQVPNNDHGDPGAIRPSVLFAGHPSPAPAPKPRPAHHLTPVTVKRGDKGPAVHAAQRALAIPADGTYGDLTYDTVREWKAAHGFASTGTLGHREFRELERHPGRLRRGSRRHAATLAVQSVLDITRDGRFGAQTEAAIKTVQRDAGLPATGVVDGKTARALGRL